MPRNRNPQAQLQSRGAASEEPQHLLNRWRRVEVPPGNPQPQRVNCSALVPIVYDRTAQNISTSPLAEIVSSGESLLRRQVLLKMSKKSTGRR